MIRRLAASLLVIAAAGLLGLALPEYDIVLVNPVAGEITVQPENIAEDRRGLPARVREPRRPFHDRIIGVLHAFDPKRQPGSAIASLEDRLDDVGVDPASPHDRLPCGRYAADHFPVQPE